jgi:hypothetical protein
MDRAWLITWEWMGEAASKRDKVLYILPSETPVEEVAQYVERIYALLTSSLSELHTYAAGGHQPYTSDIEETENGNLVVTCGHHPWIEARIVKDVTVEREDDTRLETINWTAILGDGSEENRSYKRSKTGRISFEDAWDRAENAPRDFDED